MIMMMKMMKKNMKKIKKKKMKKKMMTNYNGHVKNVGDILILKKVRYIIKIFIVKNIKKI